MTTDRDRVTDYLATITRHHGGVHGLRSRVATWSRFSFDTEAAFRPTSLGQTTPQSVDETFAALEAGAPITTPQAAELEAIIRADIRPVFDIRNGTYTATGEIWGARLSAPDVKERIEAAIPSVGRISMKAAAPDVYLGTGFVVGNGLLLTNRHVAELFATGVGDRGIQLRAGRVPIIEFGRETLRESGISLEIARVLLIHPYWDVAVLAVQGLPASILPLTLSAQDEGTANGSVCVIGYPAFDPRNPASVQQGLFEGSFGVKRVQPGEIHGIADTPSFGKSVHALTHDCSTLGGNSGSALINLSDGKVCGLHFGGRYLATNYAVPSVFLSADARMRQAGIQFDGEFAPPDTPWASWWRRVDEQSASERATIRTPASSPANAGAATTFSDLTVPDQQPRSAVHVTIPLHISVSLGTLQAASGLDARLVRTDNSVPLDAMTEGAREPWHDSDYSGRSGFDPTFLGSTRSLRVPLPTAADPDVVARTFDGEDVLHYQNFSVVMHAKRRLALFTASNVTKEPSLRTPQKGKNYSRAGLAGFDDKSTERWFLDPRLAPEYQLPDVFFTKDRQAFDKGHIVRREDVAWGETYTAVKRANGDTFHVTNCSPQVAAFNRSNLGSENWGDLENVVLRASQSERLCVFAGPVLKPDDSVFVGVGEDGTILRAKVPSAFWKIVVTAADGDLAAFAFLLEQDLSDVDWTEFTVPGEFIPSLVQLKSLERLTGVRFSEVLKTADQFDTEAGAELVAAGVAIRKERK